MRQTRILRDRVRARSLKSRVDGISRSLTDNWHDTSNISHLLQGGFRDVNTILEKHTREIEVLWHRVVDEPMYEEATASDAVEISDSLREALDRAAEDAKNGRGVRKTRQNTPGWPEGWYPFGYHVDQPEVRLEFSMETDEVGDPLWERPIGEQADEGDYRDTPGPDGTVW